MAIRTSALRLRNRATRSARPIRLLSAPCLGPPASTLTVARAREQTPPTPTTSLPSWNPTSRRLVAGETAGLSPRRHSRQGCCSPQDPAATTGPNDACAVGKGGLRKQGADRPAPRQREGAWRSSAVLLAHERRTFNRPFAPRVELSLGLCEDLQTTAAARSRRASVAHAAVAVARGDRDLTVAPDEYVQRRGEKRRRLRRFPWLTCQRRGEQAAERPCSGRR